MKTYKLTKEEYEELQELLKWWRKKKQKKINKRIKAGKGLKSLITEPDKKYDVFRFY